MNRINCRRCQHFYVTWEPTNPNGCRAYGFKSRPLPSIVVKQSSGAECSFFRPKHQ